MTPSSVGILSLHLGLRTGWAYGAVGDKPKHGVWRLSETMQDQGEVGAAFMDVLAKGDFRGDMMIEREAGNDRIGDAQKAVVYLKKYLK